MTDPKKEKGKDWQSLAEEAFEPGQEPIEESVDEDTDNTDIPKAVLEHPSYQALEEKLTAAEQLAHGNKDRELRALSELENGQRRAQRDIERAHKFGLEKFVKDLVPVVDSLEQALQSCKESDAANSALRDGVELTLKQFYTVLEKSSVQVLDPVGESFDPHCHEAMSMQQDDSVAANTVLAVFQKGYQLYDRVLRPARVVVSKVSDSNNDKEA